MEVVPAPSEQLKNSEDATKGILEFLSEGEKKIKIGASKNITLVLGFTGSGKSTFTQFVSGNDDSLIAKETGPDTGEFIITDTGNKVCASTIDSCTIIPELVVDKLRNSTFYDCPGFGDTRDVAHDISVTYFIKKVLDSADAVKLIFTVNYPSVREGVDRQNFMLLVKNILTMVNNVEKFSDSIALIVTKVDNQVVFKKGVPMLVPDENIIENIVRFLKGVRDSITTKLSKTIAPEEHPPVFYQNVIKFVDILTKKTDDRYLRIGIFRRPIEAGNVRESTLLQANKAYIEEIIYKHLNFTSKQDDDFGYTVSAESLNIIHDLVEKVDEKIGVEVAAIGKEIEKHFLHQEISLTSLEEERALYQTGAETLLALETTEELIEPEDLAFKIDTFVVGGLGVEVDDEVQRIVHYGNFLKFLRTINSQSSSHPLEWVKGLGECSEFMKDSKMWFEFLTDLRTSLSTYDAVSEFQKNTGSIEELRGHISKHVGLLRSGEKDSSVLATSMDNVMRSLEHRLEQVFSGEANSRLKGIRETTKHARVTSRQFSFLSDLLDFDVDISCPVPGKVVLKGRFVKLSDLKQQLCASHWKLVEILGYEKVFFDESVDAKGREAQVSIIAPIWEVVGRTEIALDGSPGLDVYPSKVRSIGSWPGGRGADGQPGGVGGRGGCFLGIGDVCVNCKNLFISANGGKGGRGQDGGDGANGLSYHTSYDGDENGRLYLVVFNKDTDDKVYYGQKGGSGGDGGKGGFGGLRGEILAIMLKGGEGPVKSAVSGSRGSDGAGGSPGMGGLSRRITNRWKSVLFIPWESRVETSLGRAASGSWGQAGGNNYGIRYPATPMKLQNVQGTVEGYKENLQHFSLTSRFLVDLENSQVIKNRFRRRRSAEVALRPANSPSNVRFLRDAFASVTNNTLKWLLPYLSSHSHVTYYNHVNRYGQPPILPTSNSGKGSAVSGSVDYGLVDMPGNLLLLDLLIRKNLGSSKDIPQVLAVESVQDEYSHRMAYRAYAPSGKGGDII